MVKTRLTTWLSLLLAVSAAFGLPVARGAAGPGYRICAQIVCEHRERRTEQVAPRRAVPPAPVLVAAATPDSPAALLLDYSLFQRPPPAA